MDVGVGTMPIDGKIEAEVGSEIDNGNNPDRRYRNFSSWQ